MVRKTVFDDLLRDQDKNMFTEKKYLKNEATVEKFFIDRLIKKLGYSDADIRPQTAIPKEKISLGSRSMPYKPDYIIDIDKKPRLIIDAKAPNEDIHDYIEQCAHYCLILNRRDEDKPIKYFMLSNGLKTALYEWDKEQVLLELSFNDFWADESNYVKLRNYISHKIISSNKPIKKTADTFKMEKISKETAQKKFISCHNYIWKSDKISPESAFIQFVKIIFVKLYHDRKIHEKYTTNNNENYIEIPHDANTFSEWWIDSMDEEIDNPISTIKYKDLLTMIEEDIRQNDKKRMFNQNDIIDLKPNTIKGAVKKLEKYDLYGIDDDLNGRLFETFLNATMRGKELGQYFTPRSIVKLGIAIADIQVSENHIDTVLDGCCGTGGFIIEAYTNMKNIINENNSYSDENKKTLLKRVTKSIYGIDAAKEPMLARIARINMYLHNDGGSHVYFADGLDNKLLVEKTYSVEIRSDLEDLKNNLEQINGFDVVITNPPFSMSYEKNDEEEHRILKQYILAGSNKDETDVLKNSLKSGVMFFERYYNLLKSGGKLISIVDEAILSSSLYGYVRDFLREHFIIKAIISLHGDAFSMSKARVKTSLIYLQKKQSKTEKQPNVFMTSSIRLGVDDLPVHTSKEKIEGARELAKLEIEDISIKFKKYMKGEKGDWLITPERIKNRLDVKYCIPLQNRMVPKWKKQKYEIKKLYEIITLLENYVNPKNQLEQKIKILELTYNGKCRFLEEKRGKYIKTTKIQQVHTGDLIMSKYNVFNGAIGYVTDEFDGFYTSNSFLVFKPENKHTVLYLWFVLRSTEFRSEFLSFATGTGRQTIQWKGQRGIKNINVPLINIEEQKEIHNSILEAWKKENEASVTLKIIKQKINDNLAVETDASKIRFDASKPPR